LVGATGSAAEPAARPPRTASSPFETLIVAPPYCASRPRDMPTPSVTVVNQDSQLVGAARITLSSTEAIVDNQVVAKIDAPDLGAAIRKALKKPPTNPTVSLQADQALTYGPIRIAVNAATSVCYSNILFATTSR